MFRSMEREKRRLKAFEFQIFRIYTMCFVMLERLTTVTCLSIFCLSFEMQRLIFGVKLRSEICCCPGMPLLAGNSIKYSSEIREC